MNCSTPDLPVPHHLLNLPKFMFIASVMQSSHLILWSKFLLLTSIIPSIKDFSSECLVTSDDQNTGVSTSALILPVNIQGWFPLRLTGLLSLLSKGLWRVFSSTIVWRHQFFGVSFLYGPALTTVHDHWKDHSLDYLDLCRQSNVSAFQHTV